MGLIREPEGVDFVINSRPLTKKEEELLSKFIRESKAEKTKTLSSPKAKSKRKEPTLKLATAKKM